MIYVYRIRPNFRGAQFSWIAISKEHFAETIFADQEFRVYSILKFSAKTAKITRLENLDAYGISRQFTFSKSMIIELSGKNCVVRLSSGRRGIR